MDAVPLGSIDISYEDRSKHESIEIDLGDTSDTILTSAYASDNNQIKIKGEESKEGAQTDGEQSEEGNQPKNTSDDSEEVIATIVNP